MHAHDTVGTNCPAYARDVAGVDWRKTSTATPSAGPCGRATPSRGRASALRRDLGGAGLFLALERMTEAPLPREIAGHITVEPENAGFGFRPIYFAGRQRDGSRVWSSAQFITFAGAGGEAG